MERAWNLPGKSPSGSKKTRKPPYKVKFIVIGESVISAISILNENIVKKYIEKKNSVVIHGSRTTFNKVKTRSE